MRYPVAYLVKPAEIRDFADPRFVNWQGSKIIFRRLPYRHLVLEQWAMFVLACGVGWVGPFGTYVRHGLADRVGKWWLLLIGAYVLVRPALVLLRRLAKMTELSPGLVIFWGVALCSIPLAAIWRSVGRDAFRDLDGFAALLPFSLLCALAVWAVARWADDADRRLGWHRKEAATQPGLPDLASDQTEPATPPVTAQASDPGSPPTFAEPALAKRLPPGFAGPILALQSEDHYVRVHGRDSSALLLMRLRDAVAEMNGVSGEQVHRSWWVARAGVAATEKTGRSWAIRLSNGVVAPVARESMESLRRSGFLPSELRIPN